MKTIRLVLLVLYALAALSAGYWTLAAVDRFSHTVMTMKEAAK